MCGITGIINQRQPIQDEENREIAHLLKAMNHRGPDHAASEIVVSHVLLGSCRLRITDAKSELADMPMTSSCGRYTLVYNGEIYNHRQLRSDLSSYPFQTQSDTETLLAAYAQWGPDCLSRLEGMFAFAIYDRITRDTFLAVDPSGQKFIYYLQDKNGFVFASEIQALIEDPWREKNWNLAALSEFIAQRMILGAETHIMEIQKLEAGTSLVLKADGSQILNRYYTVPIGRQDNRDIPEITADIRKTVREACYQTFDLEVPYGHFLSGGIDSSIVTHYACEAGLSLKTYAIGFAPFEGERFGLPSTFNEFEYSNYMADYLGTDHTQVTITADDYAQTMDSWSELCGEPLDSSEAPMLMSLFQAAQSEHKVVFCGSGPDEAFDGYGHSALLADTCPDTLAGAYYDRLNWSFEVDLDRLLPTHDKTRAHVVDKMNGYLSLYSGLDHTDTMQRTQLLNLHGRCSVYEYRQMDVISMAHSIEVRSPLADTALTKTAFDFAPELKNHNGIPKHIFKEAFRGILPDRIIDRPKTGFPTPIEFWFSAAYEDRLSEAFHAQHPLFGLGLLNEDYFREILQRRQPEYRSIVYRIYLLARLINVQSRHVGICANNTNKPVYKIA